MLDGLIPETPGNFGDNIRWAEDLTDSNIYSAGA